MQNLECVHITIVTEALVPARHIHTAAKRNNFGLKHIFLFLYIWVRSVNKQFLAGLKKASYYWRFSCVLLLIHRYLSRDST